jgi:hypothetical protein
MLQGLIPGTPPAQKRHVGAFLFERNNKGNNGIQGYFCDSVNGGHYDPTLSAVFTDVKLLPKNDLARLPFSHFITTMPLFLIVETFPTTVPVIIVATMCSNNDIGPHCCYNTLQEWHRVMHAV